MITSQPSLLLKTELAEMCTLPSATDNPAGINAMGQLVGQKLTFLGFEVERHDLSQHNVGDFFVYRRHVDASLPTLCVLIHLDTVGQDIDYREDGQYIYCVGALDMKGGIHVALQALRQLDLDRHNTVVLASSDEEAGSLYSRPFIEAELDKLDPERTLVLCMEFNSGGELIVEQPGSHRWFAEFDNRLSFDAFEAKVSAMRALCQNGVKCNPAVIDFGDVPAPYSLSRPKLTFTSDGGHAGTRTADDQRDTHLAATRALRSLRQSIRPSQIHVASFQGGRYANQIAGRTEVVVDIIGTELLPTLNWIAFQKRRADDAEVECKAEFLAGPRQRFEIRRAVYGDMRYSTNQSQRELFAQMRNLLGNDWTNAKDVPRRPAFERSPRTMDFLRKKCLAHMAEANPTASDANFVASSFICLNGLGPTGDGAHSPKERALIASFQERIELFVRLVDGYLKNI